MQVHKASVTNTLCPISTAGDLLYKSHGQVRWMCVCSALGKAICRRRVWRPGRGSHYLHEYAAHQVGPHADAQYGALDGRHNALKELQGEPPIDPPLVLQVGLQSREGIQTLQTGAAFDSNS